jgi:hypothetical protein
MLQQIAYERKLTLITNGDLERLSTFELSHDEYRVLCWSSDHNVTRFDVETDIATGKLRDFIGRKLLLT